MNEVLACTGPRPKKLGDDYKLESPLVKSIEADLQSAIDEYQPSKMISGMALGIDTLWAKMALKNNIPLTCAIAHKGQDEPWPLASRQLYLLILSRATEIYVCNINRVVTSEEYEKLKSPPYMPWLLQKRNIWMVDHCTRLVAVWDGSAGGTANCFGYAYDKGTPIHTINYKLNTDNEQ